jgi:hypothetical protein
MADLTESRELCAKSNSMHDARRLKVCKTYSNSPACTDLHLELRKRCHERVMGRLSVSLNANDPAVEARPKPILAEGRDAYSGAAHF